MPDDHALRIAAFREVRRLADVNGDLTSRDLRAGFRFDDARIPLINPQRGIFKPTQMRFLLSIRTVYPRPGARVWYDDQRHVHRWLREAMGNAVPFIYFLGILPGMYRALIPSFVIGWEPGGLKARIAFRAEEEVSRRRRWSGATLCGR